MQDDVSRWLKVSEGGLSDDQEGGWGGDSPLLLHSVMLQPCLGGQGHVQMEKLKSCLWSPLLR